MEKSIPVPVDTPIFYISTILFLSSTQSLTHSRFILLLTIALFRASFLIWIVRPGSLLLVSALDALEITFSLREL